MKREDCLVLLFALAAPCELPEAPSTHRAKCCELHDAGGIPACDPKVLDYRPVPGELAFIGDEQICSMEGWKAR
jgi:hypothetical protein